MQLFRWDTNYQFGFLFSLKNAEIQAYVYPNSNHKVIKFLALQNRVFKYASWTGWILIGENLSPCVFLSFSKPQAYVRQTTASRIKELKSYLLTTGIWRRFPHFIILCESVRRVSGNFLLLFFYHYVIVYDIETAINERTQTVKQAVFESFSTG